MRVQHNIMAMAAYRNYTNNVSAMKKNLEKLSSGYKINRAGDDAAGLAISEKMRAQITGLETAQKNAKDGISLVQTAEGALTEVHDMLNRMVELATQSANGTYESTTDRTQLQKEIEQLKSEINRIADSANFNGIQLLDGSMAITAATAASKQGVSLTGMDRILQSIIDKGENPWEVNNVKTVFDAYAGAATKGKFSINFGTLGFTATVNGSASATAGADDLGSFTVTIGTMTIEISGSDILAGMADDLEYSKGNGTIAGDGSNIAKAIAQAVMFAIAGDTSADKATATLNGIKWEVVGTEGGTLTFEMKSKPTSASTAVTDFHVDIEYNAPTDGKFTISMKKDLQDGTKTETAGIAEGATYGAATVFEIKAEDIVDGAKITLGTKTWVMAVGKNSKYKTDANKVDLTAFEEGDADLLRTALSKIGATATVNLKGTKSDGADSGNVSFKLTVTENGIAVMRGADPTSANDCFFNSLQDLAKNFKMSYTKTLAAKEAQTGLTLQIGDTNDAFNQLVVSIEDCHTSAIGIENVDVSTQAGAATAIAAIKSAINYVSDVRGTLGATQNRLDHTINNLSVMTENIQDAESTIRDTDIAEEMMAYTKNNILIQSAQAMLAQANQVPQGVLQLLQ